MKTLPDLLMPGVRLVVVGINPSCYSVKVGHYYARPSNEFWRVLADVGLTDRVLTSADDKLLPTLGIGLTDLVKTPTNTAKELPAAAFTGRSTPFVPGWPRSSPPPSCSTAKNA